MPNVIEWLTIKLNPYHPTVLKDKILLHLFDKLKLTNSSKITETTELYALIFPDKNPFFFEYRQALLQTVCLEMLNDKHVELIKITAELSIISIRHEGEVFLHHKGGYTRLLVKDRLHYWWTIAKTLAAIINALAIIFLTYKSVEVGNKTNKLESQNDSLIKKFDKISLKNDSLTKEIKITKEKDNLSILRKINSRKRTYVHKKYNK